MNEGSEGAPLAGQRHQQRELCELSAELRNALLISNHRDRERMRICGGLFLLEIGGYEMSTRVSFRDGMQLAVGWFDADEEHIPFDVFTSCSRASTRERLVHQFEVSDFVDLRQKPVGKRTTAGTGNLKAQQLDGAIENPVVMRLCNTVLAVIGKSNHTRVLDGRPEHRMGL